MPLAKRIEAATLNFLLTGIEPLAPPDAALAICAALAADGHGEHSRRIFEAILKMDGVPDAEDLREAILQTHLFAGYPRVLNALAAFREAAQKAGNPLVGEIALRDKPLEGHDIEAFRDRGLALFKRIWGDDADKVDRFARAASPDLGEWAIVEGYGRVLGRPVLEPRHRSLCIVAALIPLDVTPQLKGHLRGALRTGSDKETLWKLFDVVSKLFQDGPEIKAARRAFEEVLGKSKAALEAFEEDREWQGLQ